MKNKIISEQNYINRDYMSESLTPFEILAIKDDIANLKNLLHHLTARDSTILTQAYIENVPTREIARIHKISVKRINQICTKSIKTLREIYARNMAREGKKQIIPDRNIPTQRLTPKQKLQLEMEHLVNTYRHILNDLEFEIICLSQGILGHTKLSYKEIAAKINTSTEDLTSYLATMRDILRFLNERNMMLNKTQ